MNRRDAIELRAWPGAALLFFGILLSGDSDGWPFDPFGLAGGWAIIAAASVAVYCGVVLWIQALGEHEAPRPRFLGFAAIAIALGVGLTIPSLAGVAAAALSGLLWIAALRSLPRLALVALVFASGFYFTYFGLVLLSVGLILLPAPFSSYLRELIPRRVGSARGASMIEAMAALTLLTLAVTTSVSLIHDASRFAAGHAAAEARLIAAETLMERTLATPFEARASRRHDARATVTVEPIAPGLQRIEVVVWDGRSSTRLVTLSAPFEGRP